MNMRVLTIGSVILATSSVGWAQTAPKLPADYLVLTRKSIFSRERVTRPPSDYPGGYNTKRPRPQIRPQRTYTPILIGAMVEDDGYFVAFIADPGSGLLTSYRVGDTLPLGAGTIKDISLDDMTTVGATDHATHKIAIGDTILGGPAEYPSAEAPAAPASTSAPTPTAASNVGEENSGGENGPPGPTAGTDSSSASATPAAPSSGGASSGGTARLPGETMLDYLRRRRAQQLGTK